MYIIKIVQLFIILACGYIVFPIDAINEKQPLFSYRTSSELKLPVVITSLLVQGETIGSLKYMRVPLVRICVLYDFYIKPEFRNCGYGKLLGKHVLKKIITTENPSYIVLQAGPYEPTQQLTEEERNERMKHLLDMYNLRFTLHTSPWLTRILSVVYRVLNIQEDPQFFMVYDPKKDPEN